MNDGFENRERARQLIDFSGLEYGMTDIDGITEYHDRIWVWCEIKMQGKALPVGQKLAMERFVDLCKAGGKKCLAIVADHDVIDPAQDVQMRDCAVREVFTTETRGWTKPKRALTVGDAQRVYIRYWETRIGA